jgi:hypothetical protein
VKPLLRNEHIDNRGAVVCEVEVDAVCQGAIEVAGEGADSLTSACKSTREIAGGLSLIL